MRFRPLLLTLALLLLIPGTALADGGNIVGTVYLDDWPSVGLCVDVLDGGDNVVASQQSNGGGDYNIYVAQPGSYTVRFGDCGQGYTTTQSTPVQVVGDAITPGVNGYLTSAGRITGHVVDTLHAVLTGGCVRAEDLSGNSIGETTTDGNGNYALGGLPPGDVRIRFEGCSSGNYVLQYYDDAQSPISAKTVTVAAGETVSGIDAVLAFGGRLAGHVQNSDGQPLPSICVGATVNGQELAVAWTDSNGNYQILHVPPSGAYEVGASDCGGGSYMHELKHGSAVVAPPGTTIVDFTLLHPGYITGHVAGDGNPLASICVTARNTVTGEESQGESAMNGYYEVNWIHPGIYDLTFSDCHSTGDWVSATTTGVVVGDGQTLMDVDKALAHPAPVQPGPGGGSGDGGPGGSGDGGSTGGPGGAEAAGGSGPASGDPGTTGGSADHPATTPPPRAAACRVPKLVGLSLAKARKALANAGCGLGKVSKHRARTHAKKGRVVRQKARRGASKPAGFRVAVTVAR